MKFLLVIGLGMLLSACDPPDRGTTKGFSSSNPAFVVEFLFEHEGCRAYRFVDFGISRYYVKCQCGQARVESEESCGKGCIRRDELQTIPVEERCK